MEKVLCRYMANKDPVEVVRIYAHCARRSDKSLDMNQSIEIGKKKAHEMYTAAGEHVKAWKTDGVSFSDTIQSRCSRPRRFSVDDMEPGDSGSNHDDYVATKQARRNGLRR